MQDSLPLIKILKRNLFLILGNNSIISSVLSMITGKGTFTGRNLLWQSAIELIKKSPILGYGRSEIGYIKIWYGYFSSHNMLLETLLQGGIIALFLWFCTLFSAFKKIKFIKQHMLKRILILGVFIILVALLMEAQVHSTYLFFTLALISCFSNEYYKKGGINE